MKKTFALLLLMILFVATESALATTDWYVRSDGDTSNAGGFDSSYGGTNYANQASPVLSLSDVDGTASDGTYTSSTGGFTAAMVGNMVNLSIASPTATSNRYKITTVTDANTITLSPDPGAVYYGTNLYLDVGGALKFDALIDSFLEKSTFGVADGDTIWVANDGTHNTEANIAVARDGTATDPFYLIGYNTTPGDSPTGDDRPFIDADQGNDAFQFDNYWIIKNLRLKTNNSNGLRADNDSVIQNCESENVSATANYAAIYAGGAGARVINCKAKSANGYAIRANNSGGNVFGNYAYDSSTGIYFAAADNITVLNNIVDNCTTGIDSDDGSNRLQIIGNTIDGCTTGVEGTNGYGHTIFNNSISNNTTGISYSTTSTSTILDYNNFYGNTTDTAGLPAGDHGTTLDPEYVDRSNGNFAVGTNLQAEAMPNYYGGSPTTSYTDVGAVQREEQGSGEPTMFIITTA